MKDFNVERIERASSDRRFTLGPYTFQRKPSVPLSVLTSFATASAAAQGGGVDSPELVQNFERTFIDCVERECVNTEDGEAALTEDAWLWLTTEGDENGPVGLEDLAAIVQWLVSGTTEGPTGEPSGSAESSPIPSDGTTSTGSSPSGEETLKSLMQGAPVTPA